MITWREAVRADVPDLMALLEDGWIGLTTMPDLVAMQVAFASMQAAGNTRAYVGEQAGEIVATYQLSILTGFSLTAPTRAMIEAVRVRGDLRGQGIGAVLMEDAEARAQAAGAAMMQLTSNASRKDAHRFYQQLGYVQSHAGFKKALG
jgi:GNAT superfamily N-acetyltransferase